MSQVPTDEQGSDHARAPSPTATHKAGSGQGSCDSWRVIAADGSSQAAPGQLDAATVTRIAVNKPHHAPHLRGARAERGGEDEVEPLVDLLGDEEVTLLDLDLTSSDLSLLSIEVTPVDCPPPAAPIDSVLDALESAADDAVTPLSLIARLPANASGDRQLSAVIRAWPRLPDDLRDAIWWIARGGLHRSPQAR